MKSRASTTPDGTQRVLFSLIAVLFVAVQSLILLLGWFGIEVVNTTQSHLPMGNVGTVLVGFNAVCEPWQQPIDIDIPPGALEILRNRTAAVCAISGK